MITVYFGTLLVATAVTILAPSLAMPPASYLLPDHEAGDVLQEEKRDVALARELDEMRALERAFAEQDAVVGEDADGEPVDVRKAADERRAVERLELVELGGIDDPRDHVAHVVGRARIRGHDAVEILCRIKRLARLAQFEISWPHAIEVGDDAPRNADGVLIAGRIIVGHAGLAAVHLGAAQLLRAHLLARCGLHQRRTAEEDGALIAHDDAFVRHGRHIGAAGGA